MRIDAERLRGFLDCMHEEADERDKRTAQISQIVKAAKEAGFDTKAVRKVFARERMDEGERARQDDLLETYEGALGGKGRALQAIREGMPVGEAAEKYDVHRATLARARHVANGPSNATTPPHDPTTGEITDAGVEPPAVAEAGTSNEGQSTITLPAASATTILADPDVAAMLEAGARWNASARRERGEAA